jgi:putative phosphoesterase
MKIPVARPTTVGLISDTHGVLRPEALDALRGVDFLVHAGDIGSPDILATLSNMAPLTAVRGNNDLAVWAAEVPLQNSLSVGTIHIQVVHERSHLKGRALPMDTRVVVYGHSHRPAIELEDGILYVNPGSAGPRRFKLPVTVALLRIAGEKLDAEIVVLQQRRLCS